MNIPPTESGESSGSEIPSWIKNNAEWWSNDQISDREFISGIEHLIQEEIIVISKSDSMSTSEQAIPDWIKNTSKWWSQNQITDDEFVTAIEFLVKKGIIRV